MCIHWPHRKAGYGSKRWLFALNGAIFKTMISMANAMTVLALGLVIGIAVNKTSPYHTGLVGLQMTIMTYSVFLTHYFVWRTRGWFPRLGNSKPVPAEESQAAPAWCYNVSQTSSIIATLASLSASSFGSGRPILSFSWPPGLSPSC
jgi:hypothetical protein